MDSGDDVGDIYEDIGPGLPPHQLIFDELLDKYDDGIEPLNNWTTADLVSLSRCVDSELQARQPASGFHYALPTLEDSEEDEDGEG